MKTEELTRQARVEIFSCSFCKFIQDTMGIEELKPIDERKYLFHLKQSHGIEP